MAIGKQIVKRLEELGWERRDLLEKVPTLSVAALSNLIRRDSKRSEFDVVIAEALGISIKQLVYSDETTYPDEKVVPLTPRERTSNNRDKLLGDLESIAETMNERGITELIGQARLLANMHPKAKQNHSS